MTELKPCPFCSNIKLLVEMDYSKTYGKFYNVVCDYQRGGCGASGGNRATEAEAIEAWDLRVGDKND